MTRLGVLLGLLLVAGCVAPRNSAPISTGVPDGMIVARDFLGAGTPAGIRSESIVFVSGGQRYMAVLFTPVVNRKLPARIVYAESPETFRPPHEAVCVVSRPTSDEQVRASLRKVAEMLEEVDPARITG